MRLPKKLGSPTLRAEADTLIGTLDYGSVRVATGTMGYKHRALDTASVQAALSAPNYLLKIIPHVDGSPRICERVRSAQPCETGTCRSQQPQHAAGQHRAD